MAATLKDVSQIAGVSLATVSHVVNGTRPVSDALKTRVEEAIRQTGYTPNFLSRSLKVSASRTIGLALQDIRKTAAILIDAGSVDPTYTQSMLGRDGQISTYLGSGIAIPHGMREDSALVRQTARSVGVCGNLAAEAAACPILVGLGVDELSVSPPSVPELKARIRNISLRDARRLAERALACGTAAEVRALR